MTQELILGNPTHKIAALVRGRADVMVSHLPAGDFGQRQAWMAATLNAISELPEDVTPKSVFTSVANCASMGLSLAKPLGQAYLVPFWNTKANCRDVQLIPGYQGFLHLAYQSGFLKVVHADVVLDGERFEIYSDESGPHFRHELMLGRTPSRENIAAAYCTFSTRSGGQGFKVVERAILERTADDSIKKTKGFTVWKSDYPAMALKTAVRHAAKLWPKTAALQNAIWIDEQAERFETQSDLVDQRPVRIAANVLDLTSGGTVVESVADEPAQELQDVLDAIEAAPSERMLADVLGVIPLMDAASEAVVSEAAAAKREKLNRSGSLFDPGEIG